MKPIALTILAALGATMLGYGTFNALGQSTQSATWQLMASPSSPPFAWKLNTATGAAYFCAAAQKQCSRMTDDPPAR
jgi:hypothetical protein